MGINQWFKDVFPSVKNGNMVKLKDVLPGKKIGVDVSIWLHTIASSDDHQLLKLQAGVRVIMAPFEAEWQLVHEE